MGKREGTSGGSLIRWTIFVGSGFLPHTSRPTNGPFTAPQAHCNRNPGCVNGFQFASMRTESASQGGSQAKQ
eukprot:8008549-Pyramimonas_sp.AAC.1